MCCEKMDSSELKEQLFEDLMAFILRAEPGDDLARDPIASRLEALGTADRADVVDRTRRGRSPLILAAIEGLSNIAIHLLDKCDANIEKKGVFEVEDEFTYHYVTPLWFAAVFGQLKICEVLVERGADIHAVSDTGSTAIRSACSVPEVAIVEYLVDKGANVNRANDSGGTCLINSVRSVELSQFLILKGANVNARDSQLKTALHYAVEAREFETVKLLLRHNVDHLARIKYGDDALQIACLEGSEEIANHLMDNLEYPPARIAEAYKLLETTFVERSEDVSIADDTRRWL